MQRSNGTRVQPRDVLAFLLRNGTEGGALAVVTGVTGPSPRAPGTMMAVTADERICGYVSNGCVDLDVAGQALQAVKDNAVRTVRYGEDSLYKDVRLPCGGAMDLILIPSPDPRPIERIVAGLDARRQIRVHFGDDGTISVGVDVPPGRTIFSHTLQPELRLAIAGNGVETLAMARVADAAGYEVLLTSSAHDVIAEGKMRDWPSHLLSHPTDEFSWPDDQWAAIVLFFHDHDWEPSLLERALTTRAFYIGAMGSARTHRARLATLSERGLEPSALARIRGPIGVVPSVRDASALAVSTLAEILAARQGEQS